MKIQVPDVVPKTFQEFSYLSPVSFPLRRMYVVCIQAERSKSKRIAGWREWLHVVLETANDFDVMQLKTYQLFSNQVIMKLWSVDWGISGCGRHNVVVSFCEPGVRLRLEVQIH